MRGKGASRPFAGVKDPRSLRNIGWIPQWPGQTRMATQSLVQRAGMRPLATSISLWLAFFALFAALPQIDLLASRQFVDAACLNGGDCHPFPTSQSGLLVVLREWLRSAPLHACWFAFLLLIWEHWEANRYTESWQTALERPRIRLQWAIVLTALLGPTFLVEDVLKPVFGRPRPGTVEAFGGFQAFAPVGSLTDACTRNCSFVSGEAAGIALIPLFVLLIPKQRRRASLILASSCVVATCLLRVAFGRHFISDVVLGVITTFAVFFAIRAVIEGIVLVRNWAKCQHALAEACALTR